VPHFKDEQLPAVSGNFGRRPIGKDEDLLPEPERLDQIQGSALQSAVLLPFANWNKLI
jgi:hypothetical protein